MVVHNKEDTFPVDENYRACIGGVDVDDYNQILVARLRKRTKRLLVEQRVTSQIHTEDVTVEQTAKDLIFDKEIVWLRIINDEVETVFVTLKFEDDGDANEPDSFKVNSGETFSLNNTEIPVRVNAIKLKTMSGTSDIRLSVGLGCLI